MDHTYNKLKEMLEKELGEIVQKGTISAEHLNMIDKVVDIIKDINEICGPDDSGYSRGAGHIYYDRGNSYRGGNSYGGRYGHRGGNRHDEREEILDRLDYLMANSGTEQERQAIRQALNTLENM